MSSPQQATGQPAQGPCAQSRRSKQRRWPPRDGWLHGLPADTMVPGPDLSADRVRANPFFSFDYGDPVSLKPYSAAAGVHQTVSLGTGVRQTNGVVSASCQHTAARVHCPRRGHQHQSWPLLGLGASAVLTTSRLRDLTRTAQQLAEGDLEARAEIARGTEVGALASAFNQMAQRLRDTFVHLREAVAASEALSEERKRLIEELEHRNRELEGVLYATSHDLRAPLVNIQGFSQRVEKAVADPRKIARTRRYGASPARRAHPEGPALYPNKHSQDGFADQRLAAVVANESRQAGACRRWTMNAMLQTVFDSMAFQLQRVTGSFRVDPLPPCWGDGEQINRVFSNLVDNAIKYRDTGSAARDYRIGATRESHRDLRGGGQRARNRARTPGSDLAAVPSALTARNPRPARDSA